MVFGSSTPSPSVVSICLHDSWALGLGKSTPRVGKCEEDLILLAARHPFKGVIRIAPDRNLKQAVKV